MGKQDESFRGLLYGFEHWIALRGECLDCEDAQRRRWLSGAVGACEDRIERYLHDYILAVVREEAE